MSEIQSRLWEVGGKPTVLPRIATDTRMLPQAAATVPEVPGNPAGRRGFALNFSSAEVLINVQQWFFQLMKAARN